MNPSVPRVTASFCDRGHTLLHNPNKYAHHSIITVYIRAVFVCLLLSETLSAVAGASNVWAGTCSWASLVLLSHHACGQRSKEVFPNDIPSWPQTHTGNRIILLWPDSEPISNGMNGTHRYNPSLMLLCWLSSSLACPHFGTLIAVRA